MDREPIMKLIDPGELGAVVRVDVMEEQVIGGGFGDGGGHDFDSF